MRDTEEQQQIREKYAAAPGTGHMVEQLMGERENALALGQKDTVERTEAELEAIGYDLPEKRAQAAAERKAAAEASTAEEKDEAGNPPADARRQMPAERKSPQDRQASAQQPPLRAKT